MKFKVGGGTKADDRYFHSMMSMIADINNAVRDDEFNLNEWETNFVSDMGAKLNARNRLTDPEDRVLEKLWIRAKR